MIDLFYLIVGLGFLFSLLVRGWLASTYGRWSRVRNSLNLPGSVVAREVLERNNLSAIALTMQHLLFVLIVFGRGLFRRSPPTQP